MHCLARCLGFALNGRRQLADCRCAIIIVRVGADRVGEVLYSDLIELQFVVGNLHCFQTGKTRRMAQYANILRCGAAFVTGCSDDIDALSGGDFKCVRYLERLVVK